MMQARWYQDEAIYALFNYFQSGKTGNPIVAMPTGTGKSLVIALFIYKLFGFWPDQRVLMLTHVSKLISQNAAKMLQVWPNAPMGIHSAGLNQRDAVLPIIFGGVQSVAPFIKKCIATADGSLPPHMLHVGWRDLIIIDECHLLSPDDTTQYQFIINALKAINPYLKVIGLSATPYRLKHGMLTDEGGIFTDICYDITSYESFNRLVAEGFLAPLIGIPTQTRVDMSQVGTQAGEFNAKQTREACSKDDILERAMNETVYYGQGRHSWMVFNDSIENAELANEILRGLGVNSVVVHSKIKDSAKRIVDFQNGQYDAIVNKDMLTTGFDHPPLDLIADVQPTKSPSKHVQKNGRGTRTYDPSRPGEVDPDVFPNAKWNCLALDFANNFSTLGPVNDPKLPRKPGKGGGDAPIKICPSCNVYNHGSVRYCFNCNHEFQFDGALFFARAADVAPMRGDAAVVEYLEVSKVIYNLHIKEDRNGNAISAPSIKVTYFAEFKRYNEWVCFEHGGLAQRRAHEWWQTRHNSPPPTTTAEALMITSQLRTPKRIRVHMNAKPYPQILGYDY